MTPKSRPKGYLTPEAYNDPTKLPGNIRRQMIIAVDGLEVNLRPTNSKRLDIENDPREVRRLRLVNGEFFISSLAKPRSSLDSVKDLLTITKISKS